MRKIIYFNTVILLLLLVSCKTKTAEAPKATPADISYTDGFSTYPKEIEGCSCMYASDSTDLKTGKYRFVRSLSQAYMVIEGKPYLMDIIEENKLANGVEAYSFENDLYKIFVVATAADKTGDELWFSEAKVTLVNKAESTTKMMLLRGECGC